VVIEGTVMDVAKPPDVAVTAVTSMGVVVFTASKTCQHAVTRPDVSPDHV
jgi:hypothetical protein